MRSRYSAFALRRVDYLFRTLHSEHRDRRLPEDALLASLRRSCEIHRFMGLAVLDASAPDERGIARVLFHAKVFQKGRDVSIVECSDFSREDDLWRYLSGVLAPRGALRDDLAALTLAAFLAAHSPR